tara:strand:- start:1632 stop:1865 length:234 start_codon:yes stop_codon:yes gene_type:complete
MAHENTVIQSINLPGEAVCVDIFQRTDGSFGYDEFRRDPEDGRGWFSIRHADGLTFDTAQAALDAAIQAVEWLADEV